ITPTLLGIAGIEKPGYMKGYDLAKLISGSTEFKREGVYMQISEDHVGRAVATPTWKYAVIDKKASGTRDPNGSEYTEAYLYDLKKDPFERSNLIGKEGYSEIRLELRRLLHELMVEAGEVPVEIKSSQKNM
ncbi:MAG: arylsulfatase, partial [Clostridia bacterium]|nr:arylsulfatase [Clostridia bacterium]